MKNFEINYNIIIEGEEYPRSVTLCANTQQQAKALLKKQMQVKYIVREVKPV